MSKQEKQQGSWKLFLISIGLLFIMVAPKTQTPMLMIIGGLIIVLMGVIMLRKDRVKERRNKK
ncbi:multidrug transporter [Candidatus Arthromitus sp. SFB-turkey]|uniref:multidrug transporter n=1 Tax=Candidatus Arthromitus sp. SFB-turkey TaxID=1840217 RepID=UPI0007F416B8|nr:multidrug transporter [Candidatus Arthromitus sp. SFB-turkey]OAT89194.1 multidrug transporter [Candidatus Arthromitus sp. SFB-turkey]